MLGFTTFTPTRPIPPIRITNPIPIPIPTHQTLYPSIKTHNPPYPNPNRKTHKRFKLSFSEDKQQLSENPDGNGEEQEDDDNLKNKNNNNNGGDERPRLNLKWSELLFDPDPNNVAAVGLTGFLAWASVQVLWQLFVISFAILVAAVKYSFIAAILIFILITLL